MENSYGIGVTNRYALFLDDESDPLEVLKLKEQEKELRKKTKVAEKENKGKVDVPAKGKAITVPKKPVIKDTANHKVADSKRDDVKPNNQRSNDNKPERSYNKFNNENREERNNRRNREDKPFNGPYENRDRDREDRPRRATGGGDGEFESRRRGGGGASKSLGGGGERDGRGDGRGGRGDRGERGERLPRRNFDGERRGKREFDRQSGSDKTGVKPIDKREGGGAHNWGSNKDVIDDVYREADKNVTSASVSADAVEMSWTEDAKPDTSMTTDKNGSTGDATKTESASGEVVGGDTTAGPVADVVEEPKEITLDEWKAQRAGRLKPTYNLRKAGEGEDPTQWKKMYELNKKKDGEEEDSDEDEYDAAEYPQRVGRQKHLLEIDIQFNDGRRGGGGPGGGRGGGDGPRGGGRGPRGDRGGGDRGRDRGGGGAATAGGSDTAATGEKGDRPRGDRGGRGGRDRGERRGGDDGGASRDAGGGGPTGERRNDRRFNRNNIDDHQGEEKTDIRNAPKVDDERDFPSLG